MIPEASPTVYLSFDDGPSRYTPQVLAVLDRYGVRATFFEVGQDVASHPDLTRQVDRQGDSIQNHTWSHRDLRFVSERTFTDEVTATDKVIRAQTGYTPTCLRPPFGLVNSSVYTRAAQLGKQIQLYTVDPRDWARPGIAAIEHRVLTGVRPGSVILLHDGDRHGAGDRSQTIAALPTILSDLTTEGYTFATLPC